jgi:L-ascorbate metabolism protein UlaG (beta-lactamase superfamily)
VAGPRVELTYVGHATVLIALAGLRLITDPLLGRGILHVRRRVPVPALEDLRGLDAILISHAHRDHLDHRSLRRLTSECPVIVPRGCAGGVRRSGARTVIELDEGLSAAVGGVPAGDGRARGGGVLVEAVHAAHNGRRYPLSHSTASLGYLLHGPPNIYFAGDTDLFGGMSALAGRVDVALLPIWGWGPSIPAGHLDPLRAAEAVARIRPQVAVPIHWGTLRACGAQRGRDPLEPARAFVREVKRLAPATDVRILRPGQQTAL